MAMIGRKPYVLAIVMAVVSPQSASADDVGSSPPAPMTADAVGRLLSGDAARAQVEHRHHREPVSASPPGAPSFVVPMGERRAQSVGPPNDGTLQAGVALPTSGDGFLRRVRPKRDRFYGTDETIAQIVYAGARLAAAFPGTQPMLVGDISRANGGKIRPHRSHQTGRDADIAYLEVGNPTRTAFRRSLAPREIDFEKTWFLMETFLLTGRVEFIFVDRSLMAGLKAQATLSGWGAVELERLFLGEGNARNAPPIRHSPGHDAHFHIRFVCPQGDVCR
jgi:hypothetical protein